mmetsp:Transcript_5994/g.14086  ORF Transcript_5994/g.14086 Transcript_5994/m.14086 type:complete len:206 (+) Transcript_5994:109-726(+)
MVRTFDACWTAPPPSLASRMLDYACPMNSWTPTRHISSHPPGKMPAPATGHLRPGLWASTPGAPHDSWQGLAALKEPLARLCQSVCSSVSRTRCPAWPSQTNCGIWEPWGSAQTLEARPAHSDCLRPLEGRRTWPLSHRLQKACAHSPALLREWAGSAGSAAVPPARACSPLGIFFFPWRCSPWRAKGDKTGGTYAPHLLAFRSP